MSTLRPATPTPASPRQLALFTLALVAALLLFDASGIDMPLARIFGDAGGFPLKSNAVLETVFHKGGRLLAWGFGLWLCVGVWWPTGVLRRLDGVARAQLAITTLLALLAVSSLKAVSPISCPWDLVDFGRVAPHVSHWLWPAHGDGGSGRCFPAGHASSGFAFVGGYIAFRGVAPPIARRWLWASVGAGLVFGVAQQARGAHFMSHTLWTGAICWLVALAIDAAWARWRLPAAVFE